MRNKYLEILGLQPGASEGEVKSAYRKLSKRYHPDVNMDENAREKFIEINEAYNFLIKVGPNPQNEQENYNYDPYKAEYDHQRREARKRAWRMAQEEAKMKEELIGKILHKFKYVAVVIVLFNVLLSVDYLLPLKEYDQKIVGKNQVYESRGRGLAGIYRYDELYFEDFTMRFDKGEVILLDQYEKASVFATMIFKKPMRAMIVANGEVLQLKQVYNVYYIFGYIIPAMFLLMGIYIFVLKVLDHKLSLALFISILFIIQVLYFVNS